MDYGILSLLTVLLVLILVYTLKDVFISLLSGIIVCGITNNKVLDYGTDGNWIFSENLGIRRLYKR